MGDGTVFTITYILPTLATPFTNAMATDRLAGGRGIEFATHTIISMLPAIQSHRQSQFEVQDVPL